MLTPNSTPARVSFGLLVVRLTVGFVFAAHGWQKLFEYTIAGTTDAFAGMGVPLPEITAPVVAILEFAGGILLALGFLTRPVSILLAVDMAVALVLVHVPAGLWVDAGGYEFVAVLAATALGFAIAGPGRFSVDAGVFRGRLRRWAL